MDLGTGVYLRAQFQALAFCHYILQSFPSSLQAYMSLPQAGCFFFSTQKFIFGQSLAHTFISNDLLPVSVCSLRYFFIYNNFQ